MTVGAMAAERGPGRSAPRAPVATALSAPYIRPARPDAGAVRRGGGVAGMGAEAREILDGAEQVVVGVGGARAAARRHRLAVQDGGDPVARQPVVLVEGDDEEAVVARGPRRVRAEVVA